MHIKQERRCIVCRQPKQQAELLRLAKIGNQFVLDLNFKLGGRGAYICKNKQCLQQAIKKKAVNKAFKSNVGDEIYQLIGEYEQSI